MKMKTKMTKTKTKTAEEVAVLIEKTCDDVRVLLLGKNAAYGNSAIDPLRIFSKASPVEQLLVRLDDKLSRLARGSAAGEDVEWDLLGYLVLLRVARGLEEKEKRACKNKDGVRRRSSFEERAGRGTETTATARASAALAHQRKTRGGAGNTTTRSRPASRRSRRS